MEKEIDEIKEIKEIDDTIKYFELIIIRLQLKKLKIKYKL